MSYASGCWKKRIPSDTVPPTSAAAIGPMRVPSVAAMARVVAMMAMVLVSSVGGDGGGGGGGSGVPKNFVRPMLEGRASLSGPRVGAGSWAKCCTPKKFVMRDLHSATQKAAQRDYISRFEGRLVRAQPVCYNWTGAVAPCFISAPPH